MHPSLSSWMPALRRRAQLLHDSMKMFLWPKSGCRYSLTKLQGECLPSWSPQWGWRSRGGAAENVIMMRSVCLGIRRRSWYVRTHLRM